MLPREEDTKQTCVNTLKLCVPVQLMKGFIESFFFFFFLDVRKRMCMKLNESNE